VTAPHRLSHPGRQLVALVYDIGAPIAVYYLLHGFGVKNLVALVAGAALPALSACYNSPSSGARTAWPCSCWPPC